MVVVTATSRTDPYLLDSFDRKERMRSMFGQQKRFEHPLTGLLSMGYFLLNLYVHWKVKTISAYHAALAALIIWHFMYEKPLPTNLADAIWERLGPLARQPHPP